MTKLTFLGRRVN